jgi:hypothetical protein
VVRQRNDLTWPECSVRHQEERTADSSYTKIVPLMMATLAKTSREIKQREEILNPRELWLSFTKTGGNHNGTVQQHGTVQYFECSRDELVWPIWDCYTWLCAVVNVSCFHMMTGGALWVELFGIFNIRRIIVYSTRRPFVATRQSCLGYSISDASVLVPGYSISDTW